MYTEYTAPHNVCSGGVVSVRPELAAWLGTPPDFASPPDDQMTAKVLAALRVPGTDVHEVVQVHRRYLMEVMQQWTRIKLDKADHDLGLALRIDAEMFRLDSVIRWLDATSPTPRPGRRPGQFRRRCRSSVGERGTPWAGRSTRERAGQQGTVSGSPTMTGSTPPPGSATTSPRADSRVRNWTNGSRRPSTHGPSATCDALWGTFLGQHPALPPWRRPQRRPQQSVPADGTFGGLVERAVQPGGGSQNVSSRCSGPGEKYLFCQVSSLTSPAHVGAAPAAAPVVVVCPCSACRW